MLFRSFPPRVGKRNLVINEFVFNAIQYVAKPRVNQCCWAYMPYLIFRSLFDGHQLPGAISLIMEEHLSHVSPEVCDM